jgi:hypothetical protein
MGLDHSGIMEPSRVSAAGQVAGGNVTSTDRPPPGSACAAIAAPWTVAMARTMDRPRPRPPLLGVPRGCSRWKGWKSRPTSAGGMASPLGLDPTTASRGKYGTWWLGDWQGIASGAGAFHLVWNDTRTGKPDLFAATVE